MAFKKSVKEQVKAKILLYGPSGSGKTNGALLLATGIAKREGGRIALIDSESHRSRYYAEKFDFDEYEDFTDFSPDGYIKAIQESIDAGYSVCVIDGISPEWDWCLDYQQKLGGNFNAWSKVKPIHNKFVAFLLQCPIHIIACSRSKEEYSLEQDSRGKVQPKKVGVGLRQSSELDYEFTVCFSIHTDHSALAEKDNTDLFANNIDPLTEEDGEAIWDWCNSGAMPKKKENPATHFESANLDIDGMKQQINAVAGKLYATHKDAVMAAVKKYAPSGNPNSIADVETARALLNELSAIA